MGMEDPVPTFTGLLEHIREAHPNFAYVHVIEDVRFGYRGNAIDEFGTHSNNSLREVWGGRPYIAAGGFNPSSANDTVEKHGGLIAFGRHFIANVSTAFI
jgi:NADPH2 dehydrogenase